MSNHVAYNCLFIKRCFLHLSQTHQCVFTSNVGTRLQAWRTETIHSIKWNCLGNVTANSISTLFTLLRL